jgi:hypothetical protein
MGLLARNNSSAPPATARPARYSPEACSLAVASRGRRAKPMADGHERADLTTHYSSTPSLHLFYRRASRASANLRSSGVVILML